MIALIVALYVSAVALCVYLWWSWDSRREAMQASVAGLEASSSSYAANLEALESRVSDLERRLSAASAVADELLRDEQES